MVEGRRLTFEVFGLLQGVLIMVDRETGSVWTHLEGKAIQGPLKGARLTMLPVPQMTWGEWRRSNPDTMVLSQDTPFQDRYRGTVRIGAFDSTEAQFGDARLSANTLVVGVEAGGVFEAYPTEGLQGVGGVLNDFLGGQPVLVLYDGAAQTGIAYSRVVREQALEFYNTSASGFELRDRQTGSLWNHHGQAISGPLQGQSLKFVASFISEWYGWSGYHPTTLLWERTQK